jgi:hypothetical protein
MLKSSSLCLYSSNLGTFWLKIEQFWPPFPILELLPFFHQFFFLILILFVLYFKNYLEIDVKFKLQKMCSMSRSTYPLKKFLFLVMAAILDTGRRWRTQVWKGTTSESFQQSLGEIGSIVSDKIFQKVPKFELYKHNDELYNLYYRIFLWTLNFYRFWPIMQIRKKGRWN